MRSWSGGYGGLWQRGSDPEPLGVLLLPCRLEEFARGAHARDLLDIPRVVAVEPSRLRGPRLMATDMAAVRQARRLRLPGKPRVIVLYHPRQFHLARALSAHHEAELWYVSGVDLQALSTQEAQELKLLDERAREVAAGVLSLGAIAADVRADNRPLRARLVELGVINSRPFIPGARVRVR